MGTDRRHFFYFFYAPILFGATGLLFVKSLIYARLFSVESFGLLNQALLVASTFTNFAGAGLQLLGHKLLPQYHERGDRRSVDDLIGSAIGVFGTAAVIAAALIGAAVFAGWLQGAAVWYATLLMATAQFLFFIRLIDIKSDLRFMEHALLSTVRAVLLLGTGAAVAAATRDVAATLAIEGLVTLLLAAPIYSGSRGVPIVQRALRLWEERRWLVANLPAALRLLWLNGTLTLLYALDRWAGIALLTKREFGIFALGLLVILVFETLQAIVNVAAYPLMGRMIARGQHRRAFRLATVATAVVVSLTAVCYAPFVLLLDYLVRGYLPLYEEATTVIKLAVVAGALRLADFYATFAILCNEERRLAWLFGVLTLVVIAVIWILHVSGLVQFDPDRLALVTVGVSACGFVLNLGVALHAQRQQSALAAA